eukprot:TRINITY_DN48139_c0_g1_i1.p1 TRINITY_DN48139_c0_g1~~TRINITY_DN48139_c0_g1_i1.p1  ORF type:complete len:280 (-),score=43.16 TRINITY_DN48139_c0_g1_i1:15-854(-)
MDERAAHTMLSLARTRSIAGGTMITLPHTPDTFVMDASPPVTPRGSTVEIVMKAPAKMSLSALLLPESGTPQSSQSQCGAQVEAEAQAEAQAQAQAQTIWMQHLAQQQQAQHQQQQWGVCALPPFSHLTTGMAQNDMKCAPRRRAPPSTPHVAAGTGAGMASITKDVPSKGVIAKRPYKKYYSNPTPSSHCHVCARTSKAVRFATCARIRQGLCRKVICHKCFVKFGWNWEEAMRDEEWLCVHCRGACPEGRSQCFIYARVNRRRGSKRRRATQNDAVA